MLILYLWETNAVRGNDGYRIFVRLEVVARAVLLHGKLQHGVIPLHAVRIFSVVRAWRPMFRDYEI